MALGLDDYIYCSAFVSVASLDQLTRRHGEQAVPFEIPDPHPAPDVQIDRDRAYNTIHRAVDGLPLRQRAVIRAIYFVGYTVTQTARVLKISAAAVVKLRTKALKRLLGVLKPQRDALFA